MKVAILSTSFPRWQGDDAGIFVGRLVAAFSEIGLSGYVITPQDRDEPAQEQKGNFLVRRYRYALFAASRLAYGAGILPNLRQNPLLILQAPLLLLRMTFEAWKLRKEVDVYHANWLFAGLAACLLSFCTSKKYVITLRGEDVRLSKKPLMGWLFRLAMKRAAAVSSVNEAFCLEVAEKLPELRESIFCIENGVEVPKLSDAFLEETFQKYQLDKEKRYALFIGTLIPRKRVLNLLDFFKLSASSGFELLLAGRTDDQEYTAKLKHSLQEQQLEDRVHILGVVQPKEAFALLAKARLYLSASEHEGRPNALLEARLMGLPAICSDIPGHREVLQGEEDCFLFQQSLQEAESFLQELLARESNSQSRKTSNQVQSWTDCAGRYEQLFEKVCG